MPPGPPNPRTVLLDAGVDGRPDTLPFVDGDGTAGSESEWLAFVEGAAADAELVARARASDHYHALRRSVQAGELPQASLEAVDAALSGSGARWENSWVRVPLRRLGTAARSALGADGVLPSPHRTLRSDAHRFACVDAAGEAAVRVPVGYVLKLALYDVADGAPPAAAEAAGRIGACLVNDHVSPETHSLRLTTITQARGGGDLAEEVAIRTALAEALLQVADARYGLSASGQRPRLSAEPTPPNRQRALAEHISGDFYRELFTSPCLSGWSDPEAKVRYMDTCHRSLTHARWVALERLRDTGLLDAGVVQLPRPTVSLSNNGVHISVGSRRLSAAATGRVITPAGEASIASLTTRIAEHFLPVLVGTVTAAPQRFAYSACTPERMLGYLPLELHATHLRMLWRRWRKKALKPVLGVRMGPRGVGSIDRAYGAATDQPGDWVPDGRLLDYLVAPLSPHGAPALDPAHDSEARYREQLAAEGVMDASMATYLPIKARRQHRHGFSGSEWRTYSAFAEPHDVAVATTFQALVSAQAMAWVATGAVTHDDVVDTPQTESERRQLLFAAAAGVPTVYVRRETPNRLLRRIVGLARGTRTSARYPGFTRVSVAEYQRAALQVLRSDGGALVERMGAADMLDDLSERLSSPRTSASARLSAAACAMLGVASPLEAPAADYNEALSCHYGGGHWAAFVAAGHRAIGAGWHVTARTSDAGIAAWCDDVPGEDEARRDIAFVRRVIAWTAAGGADGRQTA